MTGTCAAAIRPAGCRRSEDSFEQPKKISYGEGHCMCCLNYKGKEMERRELKLHLKCPRNFRPSPWTVVVFINYQVVQMNCRQEIAES